MTTVRRSTAEKVFWTVLAVLVLFLFLSPFYIAVANSFKTRLETAENALALPAALSLDNYREAMKKISFAKSLLNTLIVTVAGDALIVMCASLSGHAIARNLHKHPYFKILDRVFLSSIMIPFQVIMIPVYKIFKSIGLINNLLGMIIMLTGISVAYATFLYVGFIKSVPLELEEAARIDGCNQLQSFCRIVFPLLKPITATVAALHAMWLWNDFNISLILLQKDQVRTLTIKQFYFFSEYASDYNMAFAAAIMGMIPVLVFFLLMQKYLVGGITAGAVKG
ncbi:MAG: carbohydrate ABC transporter permease [Candidatus Limivivens sp.]|nr:carbohydrate ABC transporter permease [Candidatus Limivivens sp.]